jgi:hypothetical protein
MFAFIAQLLLKRRAKALLGVSIAEFAEMVKANPAGASTLLRAASDILHATGERLLQKSMDVDNPRRAKRLRRRAHQRLELSRRAAKHAQDLMYLAEGESAYCSADPHRKPLT